MTAQLEAGPELDKAVAKALGLSQPNWVHAGYDDSGASFQVCLSCGFEHPVGVPHGCTLLEIPPYSTDLNAAFEAAERAGLFHPSNHITLWRMPDGFRVAFDRPNGSAFTRPTPALAICRAILALKAVSA